ncbi:MAG: hypothetical protein ACPGQL_00315 [Thermoplasmatota archaeon]
MTAEPDVILDDLEEEGRLVSLAEVLVMLQEAQETREDMAYEQKIALEHSRRFARTDVENARAIIEKVKALVPEAEEKYAVRVADLLPQHPDDIRSIFQKSRHELDEATIDGILDIVDEHYVA